MGMVDSVLACCPNCGAVLSFQSKAGECSLQEFSADAVPANIAVDIEGDVLACDECLKVWRITTQQMPPMVKMYLVKF